jgi:hypothetical protein
MSDADSWPSTRTRSFTWKRQTRLRAALGRIIRVSECAVMSSALRIPISLSVVPTRCCFSNYSMFSSSNGRNLCVLLLLGVCARGRIYDCITEEG